MKVLLADDEKSIRIPLEDDLKAAGHRVATAADGLEALRLVQRETFDCVITDIRMPGKDGFAVLREAKKRNSDTEVILITGYGTPESAAKAVQMGAYDVIVKPFYNRDILSILEDIATIKELQQEEVR